MLTIRLVLIALLILGSSGCGFKLRGLAPLPPAMERVELQGVRSYSDVGLMLRQLLEANGADVVDANGNPSTRVVIHNVRRRRDVVALGEAGKAREFQLIFEIDFSAKTGAGEPLIERRTVSTLRDYAYRETEVLSRDVAEQQLYRDMLQQSALQIIEQLRVATSNPSS
jgi:LPS-assembly lipoprotein